MSFKFRNRDEVRDSVENEGLEYFITGYCRSDAMPDEELKKSFKSVENAIANFKDLIDLDE